VDDLHERAGSRNLVHLHGELLKARCGACRRVFPWLEDLDRSAVCPACGAVGLLRPHIVWFGENLDGQDLEKATDAAHDCDICIIVGTSLQVYPASQLPLLTKPDCDIYYVDPGPEVLLQRFTGSDEVEFVSYTHVKEAATTGMAKVAEMIR